MDSLYGNGQYNEEGTATSLRCFDATNSSNQGATSPSIAVGIFDTHEIFEDPGEGSPASSLHCLLRLLACIRRYCSHVIFFALAVFACDHVAGIIPSAHHSRSLCSQAAFALRAHQPPACFVCLRVSDDTACSFYFLHSLFSLVFTWLVLIHRPITRAACAPRLHSH